MTDKPPSNMDEYRERFWRNNRVEGFGMDVSVIVPCPFCSAPGFMTYKILEVEEEMVKPHTCEECGRGAKAVVERSEGEVAFEIVQTSGPDQPDWLEPKMRRLE